LSRIIPKGYSRPGIAVVKRSDLGQDRAARPILAKRQSAAPVHVVRLSERGLSTSANGAEPRHGTVFAS